MIVYCPHITARHRYIVAHVLGYYCGLQVQLTHKREEYLAFQGPAINYSAEELGHGLHLVPCGLLEQEELVPLKPEVGTWKTEKVLFPVKGGLLPFDLFAMAFYLLSRYEEYVALPEALDEHGRFRAMHSIAAQTGNLHRPWMDCVTEAFKRELHQHFPDLVFKQHAYKFQPTIDIDMAYAYRGKQGWRLWMGAARELITLRLKMLYNRWAVMGGHRTDPNDTYSILRELHPDEKVIFFLLVGDYSANDKNLPWKHPFMKALAAALGKHNIIGVHPSYYTSEKPELFFTEAHRAARLYGQPVSHSRQHYLRFKWPSTFEGLELVGIRHDYSMGYAEETGFRASTAHPFHFFNLQTNTRSTLIMHPFMVMDVTLRRYKNLSVQASVAEVNRLIKEVKNVGGHFISLWHNDSVGDTGQWQGWGEVYRELVKQARA